jgi:hypothetical protein
MTGQPVFDAGEDRGRSVLPDGQWAGGVAAPDLCRDGMKIADMNHAVFGRRRGSGAGDLRDARQMPGRRPPPGGTRLDGALGCAFLGRV